MTIDKIIRPNIAIVCGGDSAEYEVSLRSARGLYSFFDHNRYAVYIVLMHGTDWNVIGDGNEAPRPVDRNDFSFTDADGRHVRFDYAYITIHGTPGENGILQGYFDLLRIPYSTSSVLVEALTFDKFVLNNFLRPFGVNIADSVLVRRDQPRELTNEQIVARLGLPCFVKPVADGSSFGVSKVKTPEQLAEALEFAFGYSNDVMVEAFMDGMEVTVGCYKTRDKSVVFPVTEVVTHNEFFDYDAKYNGQVDEITPARISDSLATRLQQETLRLYDLLHCNGIIRIDYIVTREADGSDRINLIEINTTPGMTATSFIPQQVRAAGLTVGDVLADIVDNQLRR
ncbi:MAG: D-alanine--D-alanine ligase [Muribaculaceae bacterium]|nr:D-alanine--D-alanine ligase [Muribaculaceae bacterium]